MIARLKALSVAGLTALVVGLWVPSVGGQGAPLGSGRVTLTSLGGQPLDTDLTAIAALTSAADKLPYATGAGTWALADLSAAARGVLDDATVGAMVDTLGGASATGTGGLVRLSGPTLTGTAKASGRLGVGSTAAATDYLLEVDGTLPSVWVAKIRNPTGNLGLWLDVNAASTSNALAIYTGNGSVLAFGVQGSGVVDVFGVEGTSAVLNLKADNGDDATDTYTFTAADAAGGLTLANNSEDLTIVFAADLVTIGTGTGVLKWDFGTIILEGKHNSSDGTVGVTVTTCTGFKDGLCISGS